jgi:hypothetical protein
MGGEGLFLTAITRRFFANRQAASDAGAAAGNENSVVRGFHAALNIRKFNQETRKAGKYRDRILRHPRYQQFRSVS